MNLFVIYLINLLYQMNNSEKITNIKLLRKLTTDKEDIKKYLLMSEKEDINEILGMIYSKNYYNLGFTSKCFFKYEKDENEYLQLLECPSVDEGMFQCNKCKSKKIFTMSKQTRSGDEATTVFARCSECKNGWIVN